MLENSHLYEKFKFFFSSADTPESPLSDETVLYLIGVVIDMIDTNIDTKRQPQISRLTDFSS